ncbi:hypothetical protein DPEC_G00019200 [Dallia pectoralis]|uniref:Uncharacterized protein n=1 Tax=Dallia pectoralis TaxID=75939 RepID=A0ACC2HG95_DALPE|nr:hypothetical protein DPEC_G00019200 [Dallia pectoralis]
MECVVAFSLTNPPWRGVHTSMRTSQRKVSQDFRGEDETMSVLNEPRCPAASACKWISFAEQTRLPPPLLLRRGKELKGWGRATMDPQFITSEPRTSGGDSAECGRNGTGTAQY